MRDSDSTYNPIYKVLRCPYGKTAMPATITIYGVLGSRKYSGITGSVAMRRYREEWEQYEADNAFNS